MLNTSPDRLQSDRPVTAQLSGGLDSSSIVCTARDILGPANGQPALTTLSLVYPGLDCDETAFINAVAALIRSGV